MRSHHYNKYHSYRIITRRKSDISATALPKINEVIYFGLMN